ncbi:hypothetical protein LUZ60_007192 [Juncus effusus]|nr:hypothetical protein LUZ60_007192 [Juncus effusus]
MNNNNNSNASPIPIQNGTVNFSGSGPNGTGVSSLVTDANSCLSGGPHMQRSASINTDSYMRGLPASPMSFSSNNISNSSVIDGSSIIHPNHEDHMNQKRRASSSVTSQLLPPQKKSRADITRQHQHQTELFLQQQALQQQQFHQNPQLHAMLQQHRLAQQAAQQQQMMVPQQIGRVGQIMQQGRPQGFPPQQIPVVKSQQGGGGDSGLCFRRLMQYLYHKRQKPADNSISYWRKLVDEYFAPKARKRWCVSLYDNRGSNGFNSFQHNNLDAWRCEICGAKSGKGFEAPAEILPRLSQIKFDRGVMDEHLFLDLPHEYRLNSGIMVLEYGKAVQESVYDHVRVIHEGRLRIIFTPELKIISWEFCARRHEEFVPRRFVAPQVNQLLQVAQKYQAAVNEGGSNGVSPQDTQTICNMFVTAGRQMAKNLEIQLLNEHGFSKRYVRCLQISEVVNSMKDLIDFSQKNKTGPIDGLKSYASQSQSQPAPNLQQTQTVSTDTNPNNQFMTVTNLTDLPSTSNAKLPAEITNLPLPRQQTATNSTIALANYQNMLKSSMFNMPSHNGLANGLTGHANLIQQQQQQHVIQQLLQEVKNNSRPVNSNLSAGGTAGATGTGGGGVGAPSGAHMMNRSSSFKSVGSNNNNINNNGGASTSCKAEPSGNNNINNNNNNNGNNSNNMDLPELEQIGQEFDSSLFDGADNINGFGWKI